MDGTSKGGMEAEHMSIEARLDQLSIKMDQCLEEVKAMSRNQLGTRGSIPMLPASRLQKQTSDETGHSQRTSRFSSASQEHHEHGSPTAGRITMKNIDLQQAYKSYASNISNELADLELVSQRGSEASFQEHCQGKKSVLRVVRRTRLDYIWETLDDPNSSKTAWWLSQAQSCLVVFTIIFGTLKATEEEVLDPLTVAVVETCFDSVFCLEFILRIISAPSKFMYFTDPVNIADIVCVLGLPLRASIGFVYTSDPETLWVKGVQIMLIFFLPLFRFLKLLRYFETTRLLIDACAKSAEAVPVLSYMMALIVLVSATFIYFFEDRNNIPSMPHALWLAVVTMTTVGYGDYFPKSLGGYLTVAVLTFISVVFLALPVGIVGFEFQKSWNSRGHMLLLTRLRNNLSKWQFNAGDVQILMQYADVDGDGRLTLGEFVELIRQMRIGVSRESAAELFTLLDADCNGFVDEEEFIRSVLPDEYIKEVQRSQREALPECKRQIKKALGSLDSLRVGLLPPEEEDAVDAVSPTLSTSSKDDRKDPEDDLFHEPL